MDSPPPLSRKPPLTPPQIVGTVIAVLTSNTASLASLSPFIPHLTPPLIHSILCSKTLASRPTALLSFFTWAQSHIPALTIDPTQTLPSFLTILSSLFSHNKFVDAKSLLVKFISADRRHFLHQSLLHPVRSLPRPSKALLDTAVGAYVQLGNPHLAIQIFKKMKRLRLKPNLLTCNTLLNSLVKYPSSNRVLLCKDIFNDVIRLGVKPNTNMFNILMNGYCMENKFKEALELLSQMGNLGEAFKMMNEMGGKGLKMDKVTLNSFLHTLCCERKVEEAYELLSSVSKRGYIADEVSYGTLIMGYFKDENVDKAMKLWDEMKAKAIIPSLVTYNSLIGGLCKSGKMEQAITKLNELLENGLVPDETTYNSIIHGYCWEGNVEKAFQFHNKMVENSFKPDIFTCNILLCGLCKEGMLEKALKLFNTWISKGRVLDVVTYNTLITALCKEGRLEDALGLVVEMEVKKLGPDRYTYNAIIGALTEAGRNKEAEELLEKMAEMSFDPSLSLNKGKDIVTCEILEKSDSSSLAYAEQISELCTEGKYKDAMHVFGELTQKGVAINKSTYITLMKGLVKRRKSISKGV
ncbi:hypothetical protein Vadar_001267 [Vaccinium darrowii]|uniref:Uncharacterized protein n=1 Tax=Vaccinium darrowii TaxID=229202 RepID=A0ACB7Z9B6_9ERIC|nr:hypothetical protein Vadar_001267 [Vaccinium darrowii]